jgi:hypothetical protein
MIGLIGPATFNSSHPLFDQLLLILPTSRRWKPELSRVVIVTSIDGLFIFTAYFGVPLHTPLNSLAIDATKALVFVFA